MGHKTLNQPNYYMAGEMYNIDKMVQIECAHIKKKQKNTAGLTEMKCAIGVIYSVSAV